MSTKSYSDRLHATLTAYDYDRAIEADFPNVAAVREQIGQIADDPPAVASAMVALHEVLDLDLAEHVQWPLPSLDVIDRGSVACKEFWRAENNKTFQQTA